MLQIYQIVDFLESAANDTERLGTNFSTNLIDKSFLFLKYIITSAFLSQALNLMDISHQFYRFRMTFKGCKITEADPFTDLEKDLIQKGKEQEGAGITEKEMVTTSFQDDFFYDLAYNIAFNQVIYTGCLIYLPISPVTAIFGFLYFLHKWLIDKYNLCFVYPRSYDGKGDLSSTMWRLGLLSLIFQQFVMFGLFYIAVPNVMLYRFVLFSALAQIFFFIAFTALSWDCLLVLHRKTRSVNFMTKEEELKWNYDRGLLSTEEAT